MFDPFRLPPDPSMYRISGVVRIRSAVLDGVRAREIAVEASDVNFGDDLTIVGLPDVMVRESRRRVLSASRRQSASTRPRKTLFNLAPADVPKIGTALDLPMAVAHAALGADLGLPRAVDHLVAGEIGLDGSARGLQAALPIAMLARELGVTALVLPKSALAEAALVDGVDLVGVDGLADALRYLAGNDVGEIVRGRRPQAASRPRGVELADVRGQPSAVRALIIAAAGGHNLLLSGPPGAGKTLLARTMIGILPDLDVDESLDVAAIHASVGLSRLADFYVPPFRAPHHTASRQALVGGGVVPRPGEITLAHRGLLFLDELPEFTIEVLESLRQPLEDHVVTVARAQATRTFPADFMLLAAMNPCPCGFAGDQTQACRCTPRAVERYRARVSGPLLDRIDLHLPVRRVPLEAMVEGNGEMTTEAAKAMVAAARERQVERAARRRGARTNARASTSELDRSCGLKAAQKRHLVALLERLRLSARAFVKVLRIARTIADIETAERVDDVHLHEAVQYRGLDRRE